MVKRSQSPKVPLRDRLILQEQMLKLLKETAKDRKERQDMVPVPGDPTFQELGWVKHERAVMLDAVNHERSARGLASINIRNFMIIERKAVGHSDYASKLALYCAEMVVGEIEFEGAPAVVAGSRRTPR